MAAGESKGAVKNIPFTAEGETAVAVEKTTKNKKKEVKKVPHSVK